MRLPLVAVWACLHVRQHGLTEMKRCCQIGLNVSLPLFTSLLVGHRCAVLPIWTRDTTVVDQHIDAVVKELRRFFNSSTDLWDGAKVAHGIRKVTICDECVEMNFSGVFQFFFIEVEDEDFVALLEKVAS